MADLSAAALAERLAHLERAHHRLKRLCLSAFLLLAAALSIAATSNLALEGTSLKLLDATGKVRILMSPASGLSFLDDRGKARAILGIDGEGPGLVLYGDTNRAILNVNHDGPALAFTGSRGTLRAIFALVPDGPGLVLFDGAQRERAQISVRGSAGAIAVLGDDGRPLWHAPGTE